MATSSTPRKRSSSTKSAGTAKSGTAKSRTTKAAGTTKATGTAKSSTAKSRSTARAKKVAAEPPKERQTAFEAPETKPETPARSSSGGGGGGGRTISFTVPSLPSFDRVASGAANAAMLPVAVARQVLPAKRGLPVYVGLGVLGVADVIEWPVAIGLGVGYAFLRRTGVMPQGSPGFQKPRAA
ncbi:hypothetical protein AB0A69_30145 [Streptomyces sp. NPDC045431]|uniref:hypothetical protein n=1 Tax=Streptomyces sp. NPDC045431 TaxID=3155613 RepID=UPI0033DE40E5